MGLHLRVTRRRTDEAARHAAFVELHREHARGVYNLALRLVGDREDARDISQEVLLKAFERLGEPGELNQRAWLYRVTVNACYDHLRSRRRRPQSDREAPEAVSPVNGFEQAELVRAVEATLRELPPAQRAALLLREFHGLPTGEVAYVLGTTSASAAVTLSRARSRFRRHYAVVWQGNGIDAEPQSRTDSGELGRVAGTVGALAAGLWLTRLRLPQAPLPSGLGASSLLDATSRSAGIAVGHGGEAAIGIMARLADALCTKAGAVGATATLVTGSIGGAYAVEHAERTSRPAAPAPSRQAVTATIAPTRTPAADARPAASPAPSPSTAVVTAPSGSPSPDATPGTTPSSTPTPLTVGETPDPTATPTPDPTPTTTASPTPTPTPTESASPEPTASPSPTP